MPHAENNSQKQRGRPFADGVSGNRHGRPKGSRNKRTRAVMEAALSGGELPLDYLLRVMRDPSASAKRRDEMAKAAAPFLHPKLTPVAQQPPSTGEAPLEIHVNFVSPHRSRDENP